MSLFRILKTMRLLKLLLKQTSQAIIFLTVGGKANE